MFESTRISWFLHLCSPNTYYSDLSQTRVTHLLVDLLYQNFLPSRGLSCLDKDGVFWVGCDNFGEALRGDLEELQKMVNLLVVCCLNGELKIMGLFVSERWPVKWTSKAVDRTVAMRERDREERVLVLRKIC